MSQSVGSIADMLLYNMSTSTTLHVKNVASTYTLAVMPAQIPSIMLKFLTK